ncbi:hypothetical protein BCR36DRAFT_452543, partial [Piromyces finnis]
FFIPLWKKAEVANGNNINDYQAISVIENEYVKSSSGENMHMKAVGRMRINNIPFNNEVIDTDSNKVYNDLSSLSNNGPGLITTKIKSNIEFFDKYNKSDLKKSDFNIVTVNDINSKINDLNVKLNENIVKIKAINKDKKLIMKKGKEEIIFGRKEIFSGKTKRI